MKLKIKKSDIVTVIAGNDKGKTGRVLKVDAEKMRILVEQVNVRAKHQKPTNNNQKGGIVHLEMPIHYSNVMLLDSDKKATRIGIKEKKSGNKEARVRYAKTNGKDL
jgi:large subunit ribosomal protein L24